MVRSAILEFRSINMAVDLRSVGDSCHVKVAVFSLTAQCVLTVPYLSLQPLIGSGNGGILACRPQMKDTRVLEYFGSLFTGNFKLGSKM